VHAEETLEGDMLVRAEAFLALRRIALVGASRHAKDFSRVLDEELRRRGYDVFLVNPSVSDIGGRPCYARVQDVPGRLEGALLLTPRDQTERVLRDCLEAEVRDVWLHRGAGKGAATPRAIEFCEANGMRAVAGLCPFMVLSGTAWPHRLHGFFRRMHARRAVPQAG